MKPAPTQMQMNRPAIVPSHTCNGASEYAWPERGSLSRSYLTLELSVSRRVFVMAKSLLEPSQENRDNNGSLKSLAKADEEYYKNQVVSVLLVSGGEMPGWVEAYWGQRRHWEPFQQMTQGDIPSDRR